MLMVCKNECPPVITIFHFSPRGFFPAGIFGEKIPAGIFKNLFKGLNSSLGSLLQSVWHIWVCFKYILTFLFSPWGKIPAGIFPRRNFSPWGFFSAQYSSLEDFIQWQSIFSAFIHIYIVYGMDPAQLLHVVVKQAGKLYFRFTWSQTQRQFFTLCCPYTCIHSKAAPVRATCLFHLFIHFAKSLDPEQALHLRYRLQDQDPSCLILWCFFLNLLGHSNKTNIVNIS